MIPPCNCNLISFTLKSNLTQEGGKCKWKGQKKEREKEGRKS